MVRSEFHAAIAFSAAVRILTGSSDLLLIPSREGKMNGWLRDSQGGSLMRLMGFLASDSGGREEVSFLPLLAQLLRRFLDAIEEQHG